MKQNLLTTMKKLIFSALLCAGAIVGYAQNSDPKLEMKPSNQINTGDQIDKPAGNVFKEEPTPPPSPYAQFSDEEVSARYKKVYGMDIFKEFPDFPRFNKSLNDPDKASFLYKTDVQNWVNTKHPDFFQMIEKRRIEF